MNVFQVESDIPVVVINLPGEFDKTWNGTLIVDQADNPRAGTWDTVMNTFGEPHTVWEFCKQNISLSAWGKSSN